MQPSTLSNAIREEPRIAVPSCTMFEPGDKVVSRNPNYPFWMTVVAVNERTGFVLCNFGNTDRCAGNFRAYELQFHGGNEIKQDE